MQNFFDLDLEGHQIIVDNGGTLSLGKHDLTFVFAPMVHWPEVMVTYDSTEKVLFSADGFGKFGALDAEEPWDDEARRYYIGIVGKYGVQVQNLLKVAAAPVSYTHLDVYKRQLPVFTSPSTTAFLRPPSVSISSSSKDAPAASFSRYSFVIGFLKVRTG